MVGILFPVNRVRRRIPWGVVCDVHAPLEHWSIPITPQTFVGLNPRGRSSEFHVQRRYARHLATCTVETSNPTTSVTNRTTPFVRMWNHVCSCLEGSWRCRRLPHSELLRTARLSVAGRRLGVVSGKDWLYLQKLNLGYTNTRGFTVYY